MEKKIYTTVDRILQFIECEGISKREFSSRVGISHSLIGKAASIGSDKLERILSTYPDINPVWLLTGAGDMYNKIDTDKMQGDFAENLSHTKPFHHTDTEELVTDHHALNESKKDLDCPPSLSTSQNIYQEDMKRPDFKELPEKEMFKNKPIKNKSIINTNEPLNEMDFVLIHKEIRLLEQLKRVNNAVELYDYIFDFVGDLDMCQNYASYYFFGTLSEDIKKYITRQINMNELLNSFKSNLGVIQELKKVITPYKEILKQLYFALEDFNESHDNLYNFAKTESHETDLSKPKE